MDWVKRTNTANRAWYIASSWPDKAVQGCITVSMPVEEAAQKLRENS